MMQTLWYSRQRRAMEEAGDKIDANDKTAVEADLNALKGNSGKMLQY